jgi:hypothetical protein
VHQRQRPKHRHEQRARQKTRQHELLHRIRSQRPDRINLLRHFHTAQFGANTAPYLTGKNQRGDNRAYFPHHSNTYHSWQLALCTITDKGRPQLHGEHKSHNKSGKSNQRK